MRELMGHQLVVGTTGWAALGLALMKPEPDHGCVVFLACKDEKFSIKDTFSAAQQRVASVVFCGLIVNRDNI